MVFMRFISLKVRNWLPNFRICLFGFANPVLRDYLTTDACFIAIVEVDYMVDFSRAPSMTCPTSDNHGGVLATGNPYKNILKKKHLPITAGNYCQTADFHK